jgi:predicted Holliday junction resolvase-like endonuclease
LFPILIVLIILITGIVIGLILFKVKKIKKEIQEATESLKNTFDEVKRKAIEKIEYLDSKPGLNSDEEKLRDELVNILEKSEEVIAKEIEDIREELK